ncbi:hypothetical protein O6P43_006445 [Quillaja saponaria]|uniref:Uncharacterized protein n=1 Tax=Quillaja saponaria TaxID=32244 RepID=A0AAD7Q954_QUISA|nr:hypothetical protein O6P43_006445 [Quillaja saponaria]
MAGLQYNFFPTDFFYPRPNTSSLDAAAQRAIFPLQTQKKEITQNHEQQHQQCRSLVKVPQCLVYNQKQIGFDKKIHGKDSNLSTNSLPFLVWITEQEGSDSESDSF